METKSGDTATVIVVACTEGISREHVLTEHLVAVNSDAINVSAEVVKEKGPTHYIGAA